MKFLLPTGIGDSVWALHKIQGVAAKHGASSIHVGLVCGMASALESRALDFVRRFAFIDSVQMCPGYALLKDPAFRPDGCWNYIEDGIYTFDGEQWCVLVPNETLERGERLESWLPHVPINWNIWRDFRITAAERDAAITLTPMGDYAVFYPGPLDGNTVQGHNRNMLWKPAEWIELGRRVHDELGLQIVVAGAPYDAAYYDGLIAPHLGPDSAYWHNLIGRTSIGELYSITSAARFVISYQAGVGIVSTYLHTPTAIFWRPKGDSITRDAMLSFDERMASAWVPPDVLAAGTHLPLIYGRCSVDSIMQEIKSRGWA